MQKESKSLEETFNPSIGRLKFLKYSGIAAVAGAAFVVDSCKKDNNSSTASVKLGSGDTVY